MPQMSATVPNKFTYLTYHEMSATISKCQVYHIYLEMLGTYPIV